MKRLVLLCSLLIAGAAIPAAAQTRVAIGIGVDVPYVSGLVVVGRPYRHHRHYYRHRYHSHHRYYHPRAVVGWRRGVVIVAPRGRVYHRRYRRW